MLRRTLCLLGVLACARVAAAEPVRIFAVGHRVQLADAVSYDTFRSKLGALLDAAHPARAAAVQAGAGDVASHLRPVDPAAPDRALVVLPEDTGLVAVLIGSRGAAARAQTSATGAIVTLLGTYGPQFTHYASAFPDNPPIRNLVLATTDT